jgi:hypothetical protein
MKDTFNELYESIINEKNYSDPATAVKYFVKDQGLKKGEKVDFEEFQDWIGLYAQEHNLDDTWDVDSYDAEKHLKKHGITLVEGK